MSSQVILTVEDDKDIREGIRILLVGEGYTVLEAACGMDALKLIDDTVDLVILDIMLPDISGLKVCEELRKSYNVPILFLTAKSQESDKTIGLMAGGDDYISKPFSYAELIARVKALIRRYCIYRGKDREKIRDTGRLLNSGRLKIALDVNEVWKDGMSVDLTETEYQILKLLMQHPGRIFSTRSIYESVWNESFTYGDNATVMVHIGKLRAKIEDSPRNPLYIKNIWGKGYRYEAEKNRI